MDTRELKRDAPRVLANLKELEDGSVITLKGCKIYVPARFAERNLLEIGVNTYISGVYVMVMDGTHYAVSTTNAYLDITPNATSLERMDGVDFYEFSFEPGATVIRSTMLIQQDTIVFRIYDELFSKGNVPWFLEYEDLGKIFDTAEHHAGSKTGRNTVVIELIVSLVARSKENRTKYYRTIPQTRDDLKKNPPVIVPLKSVMYMDNTTNKLGGSYFSVGVTSALVYPAERTEKIEELLRK